MAEPSLFPSPLCSWHPFHFILFLRKWSNQWLIDQPVALLWNRVFSAEQMKVFLLLCCRLSAALSGSWWKGSAFPGAVRQTSALRSSEILFFSLFCLSAVTLSHLPLQPGLLYQHKSAELTKPKRREWQQRKTQSCLISAFVGADQSHSGRARQPSALLWNTSGCSTSSVRDETLEQHRVGEFRFGFSLSRGEGLSQDLLAGGVSVACACLRSAFCTGITETKAARTHTHRKCEKLHPSQDGQVISILSSWHPLGIKSLSGQSQEMLI